MCVCACVSNVCGGGGGAFFGGAQIWVSWVTDTVGIFGHYVPSSQVPEGPDPAAWPLTLVRTSWVED